MGNRGPEYVAELSELRPSNAGPPNPTNLRRGHSARRSASPSCKKVTVAESSVGGRRVMQAQVRAFLMLTVAMIIGLIGCNLLPNSRSTIYPAIIHNGKLIPLNRTTFKVSIARQEILYWSPDVRHPPRRSIHCVVLNRKNWSGKYADGSRSFIAVAGRFYQYPSYPGTIYIDKWHWWSITIRGWFE